MYRITVICLAAALLTFPSMANSQAAKNIDEFEQRLADGLAEGGGYKGFLEVVDPNREFRDPLESLLLVINRKYDGAPLGFTIIFKTQSAPNGAQVIGVIYDEDDQPVVYLAMVLVRLGGKWRVIQFSAESEYKKLLPFH